MAGTDDQVMEDEADLVQISDLGTFTCVECENEDVKLQKNGIDGPEDIDLESAKATLEKAHKEGKELTITGFCPTCGMEYDVTVVNGDLFLRPADEGK